MKLININCNLCGEDKHKTVLTKGIFTIVKCNNCGLVYMNPQPNGNELQKLYTKKYFIGGGFDKTINYNKESDKKSREEINKIEIKLGYIKRLIENNRKNLLDVGCGYGFFLQTAKNKGYNIFGNDISKDAAEYSSRMLKIQTFRGVLEDLNLTPNYFDIVTMTEVAEHLPDPLKTFKEVYRILKEKGLFVIETGNISSLKAKIAGKKWDYFIFPGHLYFFSKKTLTALIKKAGFDISYIIPPHDFKESKIYNQINPLFLKLHLNRKIINLALKAIINLYDNLFSSGMIVFAKKNNSKRDSHASKDIKLAS